jgi:hypothetical protein
VKVAIEVQGQQHYTFNTMFHKTEEDFIKQQERDQLKKDVCLKKDIELYEVATQDDIDNFINDVITKHDQFGRVLFEKNTALKSIEYYKAEYIRESKKNNSQQHQQKLDKLASKMVHIVQKYNLDPYKINADFAANRHEIEYNGKKKVFINRTNYPNAKPKAAILLKYDNDFAMVRCLFGDDKEASKDYVFDIKTGNQVSGHYKNFSLCIDSLETGERW